MVRKCKCSGGCCGSQTDGVSRRDFLTLIGAGAATAALGAQAWAEWLQSHIFARGTRTLEKGPHAGLASQCVYRSGVHTDARMHLGGIGTGNIEIGCDGQFTRWQLFNTLTDGLVPLMFAVKAGDTAKLLQTAGGPDWPRVKQIEMTGEYPDRHAALRGCRIAGEGRAFGLHALCPVGSASSPRCRWPRWCSRCKTRPPRNRPSRWRAHAESGGLRRPGSGDQRRRATKNSAETSTSRSTTARPPGLSMRAEPGKEPSLDKPVHVHVSENLNPLVQMAGETSQESRRNRDGKQPGPGDRPSPTRRRSVIWIEEPAGRFRRVVVGGGEESGRSGRHARLRRQDDAAHRDCTPATPATSRRTRGPTSVFEDFENGYDKWKVEGEAFGREPAKGTFPNQQPVTGFKGKGLVNSFIGGDNSTGKLDQPAVHDRAELHPFSHRRRSASHHADSA